MIDHAEGEPDSKLAALPIVGRTIAERQLELALALGCKRIICLSQGLDRELISLQHLAEGAGAKFNLVSGPRPLTGLISSADELVVIADGLLPASDDALQALAEGSAILMLPVEAGLSAGFERVDLNHAWSGVLAMPGRLVERLNQLPPDCDTVSSLLRIALQGRVAERLLPEMLLTEHRWALIRDKEHLAELEPVWLRRHAAPPTRFAPGRSLARLGILAWGPPLLERGWKPGFLTIAAIVIAALGIMAAWLGQAVIAILLCGLGWLVNEASTALAAIERAGAAGKSASVAGSAGIASALVDIALIAALTLSLEGAWPERLFVAAVLLASVRIAGWAIREKAAELAEDRMVLAVLLAIAASLSVLLYAMQIIALAILVILTIYGRRTKGLTQA